MDIKPLQKWRNRRSYSLGKSDMAGPWRIRFDIAKLQRISFSTVAEIPRNSPDHVGVAPPTLGLLGEVAAIGNSGEAQNPYPLEGSTIRHQTVRARCDTP